MSSEELIASGQRLLINNYGRAPIVMARGAGCELWDIDGRRYLDMTAGIAVCILGHGHRGLAAAIAEQAGRLHHTSNLYYIEMQIRLAEALARRAFAGKMFFCNSGTEANEAALKLARRYQAVVRGKPNRVELVAFENSFHGRTMGALSVTGQAKYRQGFGPMLADVRFIPFGDPEAARAAIGDRTCAVIVEPIQAEGGINLPPPGYLQELRRLCSERGARAHLRRGADRRRPHRHLLRFRARGHGPRHRDPGQGPGGRRAHGRDAGQPRGRARLRARHARLDLRRQSPGLGGGALRPAGDRRARPARALPGDGRSSGLRARAPGGAAAAEDARARGRGLLQGLVIEGEAAPIVQKARERGLLVSVAGANVVRFAPPLVVGKDEIDEAVAILDTVLAES